MNEDDMLLAVVRAAAAGFSEGLIRESRAMVYRLGVDNTTNNNGKSFPSARIEPVETASFEVGSGIEGNQQERQSESTYHPVSPYDLEQAMSAMTKSVPDGMFDPMDETEARPAWLQ